MLLFESKADINNLIFNQLDLVEKAKNCFINADILCHAFDLSRYKGVSCNQRSHQYAIDKLFAREYKCFCNIVYDYEDRIDYAHEKRLC